MFLRGIAVFLAATFLTTTVFPGNLRAAAVIPDSAVHKDLSFAGLRVPPSFGEVLETREGKSNSKVLIIQDAHSVPDAQRNIHNLIHQLDKDYGIDLIGVEGASGPLDATLFRAFPDAGLLKKTFKQYYAAGELTGGSGAALFERAGLPVIGLEDPRLDQECYARYLAAAAVRQDALTILGAVRGKIETLKRSSYPAELLKIDVLSRRFAKGEPVLAELVLAMAALEAPEKGSELGVLTAKIQSCGVSFDLAKEIRELSSYIEVALRGYPALQSALNRARQAYQTERMEVAAYASFLTRTARGSKIRVRVSPTLEAVIRFQYRFEKIQASALFKEFETYRLRIYQKILSSAAMNDARQAADLSSKLDALEKLTDLELSRDEWESLTGISVNAFSVLLSDGEQMRLRAFPVQTFRDFYESAIHREEAIAGNLERQLKSGKRKDRGAVAILVLGGFHANGIKTELEKRGISYAFISPRIESLPASDLYEQHMRGEVSWKSYLKAEHGHIRVYEAFLRAARDRLLERWQKENHFSSKAMVLKEWRDNLIRLLARENRVQDTWRYRKFLDEITDASLLGREGPADRLMRRAGTFVDGIRNLQVSNDLNARSVANLLQSIHYPSIAAKQFVPGATAPAPNSPVLREPIAVPEEISIPQTPGKLIRSETRFTHGTRQAGATQAPRSILLGLLAAALFALPSTLQANFMDSSDTDFRGAEHARKQREQDVALSQARFANRWLEIEVQLGFFSNAHPKWESARAALLHGLGVSIDPEGSIDVRIRGQEKLTAADRNAAKAKKAAFVFRSLFPKLKVVEVEEEFLGYFKRQDFIREHVGRSEGREPLTDRTVIPAGMFVGGPKVASERGQVLDLGNGNPKRSETRTVSWPEVGASEISAVVKKYAGNRAGIANPGQPLVQTLLENKWGRPRAQFEYWLKAFGFEPDPVEAILGELAVPESYLKYERAANDGPAISDQWNYGMSPVSLGVAAGMARYMKNLTTHGWPTHVKLVEESRRAKRRNLRTDRETKGRSEVRDTIRSFAYAESNDDWDAKLEALVLKVSALWPDQSGFATRIEKVLSYRKSYFLRPSNYEGVLLHRPYFILLSYLIWLAAGKKSSSHGILSDLMGAFIAARGGRRDIASQFMLGGDGEALDLERIVLRSDFDVYGTLNAPFFKFGIASELGKVETRLQYAGGGRESVLKRIGGKAYATIGKDLFVARAGLFGRAWVKRFRNATPYQLGTDLYIVRLNGKGMPDGVALLDVRGEPRRVALTRELEETMPPDFIRMILQSAQPRRAEARTKMWDDVGLDDIADALRPHVGRRTALSAVEGLLVRNLKAAKWGSPYEQFSQLLRLFGLKSPAILKFLEDFRVPKRYPLPGAQKVSITPDLSYSGYVSSAVGALIAGRIRSVSKNGWPTVVKLEREARQAQGRSLRSQSRAHQVSRARSEMRFIGTEPVPGSAYNFPDIWNPKAVEAHMAYLTAHSSKYSEISDDHGKISKSDFDVLAKYLETNVDEFKNLFNSNVDYYYDVAKLLWLQANTSHKQYRYNKKDFKTLLKSLDFKGLRAHPELIGTLFVREGYPKEFELLVKGVVEDKEVTASAQALIDGAKPELESALAWARGVLETVSADAEVIEIQKKVLAYLRLRIETPEGILKGKTITVMAEKMEREGVFLTGTLPELIRMVEGADARRQLEALYAVVAYMQPQKKTEENQRQYAERIRKAIMAFGYHEAPLRSLINGDDPIEALAALNQILDDRYRDLQSQSGLWDPILDRSPEQGQGNRLIPKRGVSQELADLNHKARRLLIQRGKKTGGSDEVLSFRFLGFDAGFRSFLGMDCTACDGPSDAGLSSLQPGNVYYEIVYRGKSIGYLGFTEAHLAGDPAFRMIAVDTVQAPNAEVAAAMPRILEALKKIGAEKSFSAVALPNSLHGSFNHDLTRTAAEKTGIYKSGRIAYLSAAKPFSEPNVSESMKSRTFRIDPELLSRGQFLAALSAVYDEAPGLFDSLDDPSRRSSRTPAALDANIFISHVLARLDKTFWLSGTASMRDLVESGLATRMKQEQLALFWAGDLETYFSTWLIDFVYGGFDSKLEETVFGDILTGSLPPDAIYSYIRNAFEKNILDVLKEKVTDPAIWEILSATISSFSSPSRIAGLFDEKVRDGQDVVVELDEHLDAYEMSSQIQDDPVFEADAYDPLRLFVGEYVGKWRVQLPQSAKRAKNWIFDAVQEAIMNAPEVSAPAVSSASTDRESFLRILRRDYPVKGPGIRVLWEDVDESSMTDLLDEFLDWTAKDRDPEILGLRAVAESLRPAFERETATRTDWRKGREVIKTAIAIMTNEGTAEKKGRSESRSVKVLERQSDPSINAKWIVFGAGAATVSLGAAIGVLGLATLSTWVVCAVLIAAGLLVYQLSAASLLRQEEIPVIATSVIPPWERVTELGFFEDILPKKYESRTPSNNAALQGSTDTSRSEMRIVQRLARAVTETPEVLRSEKRVIRGVVKPIDLPAAVKEFELPVFNATALEGLADLVVLDPDQSVEEFEAAVDERVKTLVAEDQAFMKKALMVIVALVSKKLNGATGVAFNLGSSEGESLEEALALFSHVDDLVALLPKSLSRVQAKGIRAIRLPSVAKYRPSGSLQNSNGVPVLEGGEAADAGIASNRNLYGVVSQGEVASLSEQSSKLLDKVSRIAVAILLAQRRVKKSDLDAANWKAELLSELTHSGLVANDGGLISIDGNGNVIVHLDVLASIIQQMIQTKATAVSA